MMRTKTLSFSAIAPSANGICLSQTTGAAADLVINGALATPANPGVGALNQILLNAGYKIDLTSAGNDSAVNFSFTGTDADGKALTETIAGPNANTVTTLNYFKSVTRIAASAAVASAITLGINAAGQFVTQTVCVDMYESVTAVAVDISGTINYDLQKAFERPTAGEIPNWVAGGLAAQTADNNTSYSTPIGAVRVKVNSYSAGAIAVLHVIQGVNHG